MSLRNDKVLNALERVIIDNEPVDSRLVDRAFITVSNQLDGKYAPAANVYQNVPLNEIKGDTKSREVATRIQTISVPLDLNQVTFSNTQGRFIARGKRFIFVIDAKDGKVLQKHPFTKTRGVHQTRIRLSSDEKSFLVTNPRRKEINYFDVRSGNPIGPPTMKQMTILKDSTSVQLSDDASAVVLRQGNAPLKILRLQKKGKVQPLRFRGRTPSNVQNVTTSPTGTLSAMSDEKAVYVYDLKNEAVIHTFHVSCPPSRLSFSGKGTYLVAAFPRGIFTVWETKNGKCHILERRLSGSKNIIRVSFSPCETRIVIALTGNSLFIVDPLGGDVITQRIEASDAVPVQFYPVKSGSYFVSCTRKNLSIRNYITGQRVLDHECESIIRSIFIQYSRRSSISVRVLIRHEKTIDTWSFQLLPQIKDAIMRQYIESKLEYAIDLKESDEVYDAYYDTHCTLNNYLEDDEDRGTPDNPVIVLVLNQFLMKGRLSDRVAGIGKTRMITTCEHLKLHELKSAKYTHGKFRHLFLKCIKTNPSSAEFEKGLDYDNGALLSLGTSSFGSTMGGFIRFSDFIHFVENPMNRTMMNGRHLIVIPLIEQSNTLPGVMNLKYFFHVRKLQDMQERQIARELGLYEKSFAMSAKHCQIAEDRQFDIIDTTGRVVPQQPPLFELHCEKFDALVMNRTEDLIVAVGPPGYDSFMSVAFSSDGRYAFGAANESGYPIFMWNVDTLDVEHVFKNRHEGNITGLASGGDDVLVSSSEDGTIRLWDLKSKSQKSILFDSRRGQDLIPNCVAVSISGTYIVGSVGKPSILIVWKRDKKGSYTTHAAYDDLKHTASSLKISKDEKTFGISTSEGLAYLFHTETETGELKGSFSLHRDDDNGDEEEREEEFENVLSFDLSDSGSLALSSDENGYITLMTTYDEGHDLFNVIEGSPGNAVNNVSFNPTNTRIISSGSDGYVRIWDIRTSRCIFAQKYQSGISSIACTTAGDRIFVSVMGTGEQKAKVFLWNIKHLPEVWIPPKTINFSSACCAISDKYVVQGTEQGHVLLWDVKTQSVKFHLSDRGIVATDVAISKDSSLIASSVSGRVRITSILNLETKNKKDYYLNIPRFSIGSIHFLQDGKSIIASTFQGSIYIWDIVSGEQIKFIEPISQGSLLNIVLDNRGTYIGGITGNNLVVLWRTSDWKMITFDCHRDGTHAIAFDPTNDVLATADGSGGVCVWNIETITEGLFETNRDNTVVRLWGVVTPRASRVLVGHMQGVKSVDFSPSGEYILSAADDNQIIVWHIDTEDPVYVYTVNELYEDGIVCAKFSTDGKRIISAHHGTAILQEWILPDANETRKLYWEDE